MYTHLLDIDQITVTYAERGRDAKKVDEVDACKFFVRREYEMAQSQVMTG